MTPYELRLEAEGRHEALRDSRRVAAWHAANIMQMWSRKRITPERLLGERPRTLELGLLFNSAHEVREHFRERRQRAAAQEG